MKIPAGLLILSLLAAPDARAQGGAPDAYTPTSLAAEPNLPRTPDGKPDLQDAIWATNFFPVFEASPMAATLVVPEDAARKMVATMVGGMSTRSFFEIDPEAHVIMGQTDGLPVVRGERRTRLVVLPADGKIPLTDAAQKLIASNDAMDGPKDDYEQRPAGERCLVLSGNPPMHATISYNRLRFVQTEGHVVIHNENGDEARLIPFVSGPFVSSYGPNGPTNWFGDSIARWDGDTLVIETVRQNKALQVRGLLSNFTVSEDAKVIERFTRLSAGELLYQFTVEDPAAYTAPWLAEYSFFATTTGMYPSPCHEHNHSLPNILLGQRLADARKAVKD